jgi:hypothetical protein
MHMVVLAFQLSSLPQQQAKPLLPRRCMLAYTAVLKLLKKYHKRMSRALDAPHLSSLLSESFCSTEVRQLPLLQHPLASSIVHGVPALPMLATALAPLLHQHRHRTSACHLILANLQAAHLGSVVPVGFQMLHGYTGITALACVPMPRPITNNSYTHLVCTSQISSELLAGTEKQLARFAEHLGTRLSDPHSNMPFGQLGGGRDSTAIQMAVADLKTNLVNEAEDSNDEDDHDMDDNNSVGAANSGVNSGTDVTLAQGVQQQLQQLHAQQQQATQQQAEQQQQRVAGAAGQQQQGMGGRSPDAQQHSHPHGQQQAQQQASDAGQQQVSDGMPGSHSMSHSAPGSGTGSVPMEEGPAVQHSAAQVPPPAAASPAPCSSQMQQEQQHQQMGGGEAMMVGELRAALNIWETLRDTAKTPSTVFNPALYAKH